MAGIIEEIIKVIGHSEASGQYNAVNPTDVVSIGIFQWYGARALNLARMIAEKDPSGSRETLGEILYGQVTSGNNNVWNSYRPSNVSGDIQRLKNFLSLGVSKGVQDELASVDAQSYISQAVARGISSPQAQIYFADLYNQSPKQAGNIVTACKNAGLELSLTNLHTYAMKNSIMSKYATRRNWAYNELLNWSGESVITPPVNPPNSNGGDGTAGNLPPSVSDSKMYLVEQNGTLILFSTDNPSGTVFINAGAKVYVPLNKGSDFNG